MVLIRDENRPGGLSRTYYLTIKLGPIIIVLGQNFFKCLFKVNENCIHSKFFSRWLKHS